MENPGQLIRNLLNQPQINRQLLRRVVKLTADIPDKIKHFKLPEEHVNEIFRNRALMEAAITVSIEKENFRNLKADELFAYSHRLEEKYAADISHMRLIMDRLFSAEVSFMDQAGMLLYFLHHFNSGEGFNLHETRVMKEEWPRDTGKFIFMLSEEHRNYTPAEKIVAGWLLHYAVLNSIPSLPNYQAAARLLHNLYLRHIGCDASGLLFITPELLTHQLLYRRMCDQLKYKDWNAFLNSDMESLINFGLEAQAAALEVTNEMLREKYHSLIEYDEMAPKQRNMVNYFFEEAFRAKVPDTGQLNERQKKIISLIYERHFISTKDLSLIFRVDRKTIQRDFNELLDMKLVRAMGQGSALRYTIPLQILEHNELERLQNIHLSETMVQISLFNRAEPVATKKPAAFVQQVLF